MPNLRAEGENAAIAAFTKDAAVYDPVRRALIPCFDSFYGNIGELIAEKGVTGKTRILDLGAGTGLVSAMIRQKWQSVSLQLLDGSQAMLDQARGRFAGDDLVSFVEADMTQAELGGPWDVVVSALAIHHLEDAVKRELFGRVYAALQSDGWFINADQVRAPAQTRQNRDHRMWREQALKLGARESDLVAAEERMRHDRCATLEDQLAWLRDAGFADVDCTFKAWHFAVFCAVKS
ncbi:methyltransferase [Beijerinckiaceae bacterium]|nr:methyltransferase [Beijerinckiaceae bacterium]